MDTLPKIRALFNDPSTADLTLRIDGRAYFAHKCILNLQSEWFQKYLEENRQSDEGNEESNENNRKDFDESAFQYEIYYDYDIFGYLLAYCYGWSIQSKTTDELFAIAYLAKKFKVHSLTKFTDCLLKHISKSWKPNEYKWKVGLMISKWLGLAETRLTILKFSARILIKIKDSRNFELIKSIIDKDDWNEIEKIMNELSSDEVQIENELLEDGVLGLDENGNVVESSSSYASSNGDSDNESEDHQRSINDDK
ncbi:11793_t:CDS:2 [Diversispora eburnea]|uniref:11793_t:CDS:1 n=1 Tax=Diversispora eburnea TaxID=1213867 RepID=A0A9N8VJE9_9GLOM|nr:11793_t:CDS:2 [Diversispora eburnea]